MGRRGGRRLKNKQTYMLLEIMCRVRHLFTAPPFLIIMVLHALCLLLINIFIHLYLICVHAVEFPSAKRGGVLLSKIPVILRQNFVLSESRKMYSLYQKHWTSLWCSEEKTRSHKGLLILPPSHGNYYILCLIHYAKNLQLFSLSLE